MNDLKRKLKLEIILWKIIYINKALNIYLSKFARLPVVLSKLEPEFVGVGQASTGAVFPNENLPTQAKMACVVLFNAGHLGSTQAILWPEAESYICSKIGIWWYSIPYLLIINSPRLSLDPLTTKQTYISGEFFFLFINKFAATNVIKTITCEHVK